MTQFTCQFFEGWNAPSLQPNHNAQAALRFMLWNKKQHADWLENRTANLHRPAAFLAARYAADPAILFHTMRLLHP
jgi:hypothetical protein